MIINAVKNWYKTGSVRSAPAVSTGNLTDIDDFWYGIAGGGSSSGAVVSKLTALRQWAVYACITEISETLAQLPLKLKRPDGKGGTEDATDHPLFNICKNQPNPNMTSFSWREAQQCSLLTDGNNYNFLERTRSGIKHIWPVPADSTTPRDASQREVSLYGSKIVYDVKEGGRTKTYSAKDILHIVGFSLNGMVGESPITVFARESIGNAIAIDQFQGKAMKNGYFPSGVFEHPDTLGDNKESFVSALDARFAGPENARRPMILENGMQFKKADVSMVDKQFIEQMKLSASQICGIFKVPPHRIGIFEKNTNYNNTEQGNKSFLDSAMQQWIVRWEQTLNWKLLSESEKRAGYFFKFNFDALLRPDAKTRSEISWREWQSGVPLNVIRKKNDENPIEGGDVSFVPVNMIPSHLAGVDAQAKVDADPKDELLKDDLTSLRNLEQRAVEREVKKQIEGRSNNDFDEFLDTFYTQLFDKIDKRTRLIVRCFNDEICTNNIIDEIKKEFKEKRNKIAELRKCNFNNINEIWNG